MKRRIALVLAGLFVSMPGVGYPRDCAADVVYLRDGQILYGRLETRQPEHVLFQQRLQSAGRFQQRTIRNDEIRMLVVTIHPQRLESLEPGDWPAWRDLAEELAAQRADPEARDLAMRLNLVLAKHATGDLRVAGFRGAIEVADRRQLPRLQALALQNLAAADTRWLTGPGTAEPALPGDNQIRERLQTQGVSAALQKCRAGNPSELATLLAEGPLQRQDLRPFASICTWDQLQHLAATGELDYGQRARLLRLELAIDEFLEGTPPPPVTFDSSWSVLVRQTRDPVAPVSFENVSEFDLKCTRYRDGQWVPNQ